jgi:glycosyl transferase family 2
VNAISTRSIGTRSIGTRSIRPRLSIVVPFYDVEQYIEACLDSLARQTYPDFEVILVDDGSRDGSAGIARAFCAKDDRFRLVTQQNRGLGPARNTGVEHAQGDYLAFVDSDDLVCRHAYEIMVRSLDETSSSLAAGNARRFNNTSGVRQSWVHSVPFAKDRLGTHVLDFPPLALDRMVWNKVFRRDFWDQHGFTFPAIRYEDYPVTLRAHAEAFTVDCLATPIYYWRQRESGESITQQRFQTGNLADRVTSAELVLDLLDQKRLRELRPAVHAHLAQIDLNTVAQAFATAGDDELDELLALGQRISRRLDPAAMGQVTGFERLLYHGVQDGNIDLVRKLARFRAVGGLTGGARARRNPLLPWRYENQLPGLRDGGGLRPQAYRLDRGEVDLHTTITDVVWEPDALVVRGTAEIAHQATADSSTLRVTLVAGRRSTALPVERFFARDMHREERLVGFQVRVPRTLLTSMPADSAHFTVSLRNGLLHRQGRLAGVRAGSPEYPTAARTGDAYLLPGRDGDGALVVRRMTGKAELTAARFDGDDLVLEGRLPPGVTGPELRLSRSAGQIVRPLRLRPDGAGQAFTARIPLDDLVDEENPDDPFLGRSVRVPDLRHDGDRQLLLLITGFDEAVSTHHRGRLISVTRSPGHYANITEGPLRAVADRVETEAGDQPQVIVSGPRFPGVDYGSIVWRSFRPDSDEPVDAPCRVILHADRWSASIDAAKLPPPAEAGTSWTLFAVPDGTPYAAPAEFFLLSRLPVRLDAGPRRITLRPRASTLHLETS